LEQCGYAVAPVVVGAWAVGSPHKRDRVWIVGRLGDRSGARMRPISARPGNAGAGAADVDGPSQGLAGPERDGGGQQEPGRGADRRVAAGGAGEGVADASECRRQFDGRASDGLQRGESEPDGGCEGVADAGHGGEPCGPRAAGRKTGQREPERGESGICGPVVADAERRLGPGGRPRGQELLADGLEAGRRQGERGPLGYGQAELAESEGPRCEGRGPTRPARAGRTEYGWPSRPGEPQFPWEAPRLAQFPVGQPVNGLPVRLARFANRNGLKACGNAIVPQVAAVILKWIVQSAE
jgi:site-specific DNA-cytosine methylase